MIVLDSESSSCRCARCHLFVRLVHLMRGISRSALLRGWEGSGMVARLLACCHSQAQQKSKSRQRRSMRAVRLFRVYLDGAECIACIACGSLWN